MKEQKMPRNRRSTFFSSKAAHILVNRGCLGKKPAQWLDALAKISLYECLGRLRRQAVDHSENPCLDLVWVALNERSGC